MSEVLSYKYPPINPNVKGNSEQYISTRCQNGQVFRSDQQSSIIINLASNSQFLKTVQTFLTGRLVPRNSGGAEVISGTTTNTLQGFSRCFSRLVIRFGGSVIEDITNYHDLLALSYATESTGRKAILKRTEGY